MAKSKDRKDLSEAIQTERARNEMIRETRKTTLQGLILLSPAIAMFGFSVYGMAH